MTMECSEQANVWHSTTLQLVRHISLAEPSSCQPIGNLEVGVFVVCAMPTNVDTSGSVSLNCVPMLIPQLCAQPPPLPGITRVHCDDTRCPAWWNLRLA